MLVAVLVAVFVVVVVFVVVFVVVLVVALVVALVLALVLLVLLLRRIREGPAPRHANTPSLELPKEKGWERIPYPPYS